MDVTDTKVVFVGESSRTFCDKCGVSSAMSQPGASIPRHLGPTTTSSSQGWCRRGVWGSSSAVWTMVVVILAMYAGHCRADHGVAVAPTFTAQDFDGLKKFPQPSSDFDQQTLYYRHMEIHGHYVYVGAMDYLFKLNGSDISMCGSACDRSDVECCARNVTAIDDIKLKIMRNQDQCIQRPDKNASFECRNHIRGIVVEKDRIYLCGTGAYKPQDVYLNLNDLRLVDRNRLGPGETMGEGSGTAKCPFDPNDSSTLVYVEEGNPGNIPSIYTGTSTDSTQSNPLIYRPKLWGPGGEEYELLRTIAHDSKWLNEPNFVGSFDIKEHVYLFFREVSVEHPYEGKIVYSRVARVCKKDKGGSDVLEGQWTTYLKARWECAIPGDTPFCFNHIQDVVYEDESFYGVFTTNTHGLYGSAVCRLDLSDIESFFNTGHFQEQLDATKLWQRVPDNRVPKPRPGNCSEDSKDVPGYVLQFIQARPLMYQAITPVTSPDTPLYHLHTTTALSIAIQAIVRSNTLRYHLLYLATDDGEIHKVAQWTENGAIRTNLVAIWKPFDDTLRIQQLKVQGDQLYVSTDNAVRQFDVKQCAMYHKCTSCIRDPHCGWHQGTMKCTEWRDGLIQGVEASESPLKTCGLACQIERDAYRHPAMIRGGALRLNCSSNCEPAMSVQWYNGTSQLEMDPGRFLLAQDNSLVILSLSEGDDGTFTCRAEGVDLTTHRVPVRACSDLARESQPYHECVWREEFDKWCHAFEDYREDYNHWVQLKNNCTADKNNSDRCYINTSNSHSTIPED